MLHISLFSGIGGFDLAAEWMGWTNIVSCEINDFGNKVLEHYWPDVYHHRDVKTLTLEKINEELGDNWRTDDVILTGGFPCQPYSSAGKRKGKEDERHLWPEMLRVIREIKPSYIVGENVAGLLSWSGGLVFDEVHSDLEAQGYEVQACIIPASSVGARHQRQRIWFIANFKCARLEYRNETIYLSKKERKTFKERSNSTKEFTPNGCGFNRTWSVNAKTKSIVCNGNDGLSNRLDGITFPKWRKESIKAAGNAVVPQVVYEIFKAIEATRK